VQKGNENPDFTPRKRINPGLRLGGCNGPGHPGQTVWAFWDEKSMRWRCCGNEASGLPACGHGVTVAKK